MRRSVASGSSTKQAARASEREDQRETIDRNRSKERRPCARRRLVRERAIRAPPCAFLSPIEGLTQLLLTQSATPLRSRIGRLHVHDCSRKHHPRAPSANPGESLKLPSPYPAAIEWEARPQLSGEG